MESTPQRIVVDSLNAPINGLYGIEDPATGNVGPFNSGELFGAIDVALFILVIGGFIGITMKTGAIQAGIALLVTKLRGHERWLIPLLMIGLRHRRDHLRHGRGEPGLLRPHHHRDDRGRATTPWSARR